MNGLFPIKYKLSTTENRNITPPGKKFLLETGKYYHIPKIVTYLKYGVTSKIVFLLIRQQVEFLSFQGEFHFDILNARLGRYSDFSVNALFHKKLEELKENGQANTYLSYKGSLNKIEQFAGKHISFMKLPSTG